MLLHLLLFTCVSGWQISSRPSSARWCTWAVYAPVLQRNRRSSHAYCPDRKTKSRRSGCRKITPALVCPPSLLLRRGSSKVTIQRVSYRPPRRDNLVQKIGGWCCFEKDFNHTFSRHTLCGRVGRCHTSQPHSLILCGMTTGWIRTIETALGKVCWRVARIKRGWPNNYNLRSVSHLHDRAFTLEFQY